MEEKQEEVSASQMTETTVSEVASVSQETEPVIEVIEVVNMEKVAEKKPEPEVISMLDPA